MKRVILISFLFLSVLCSGQIGRPGAYHVRTTTSTGVDSASWVDEYKAVYYAMTTPPSLALADKYNTYISDVLIDNGLWDDVVLLVIPAVAYNTDGEALIWYNDPDSSMATPDAGITWSTQGYTGDDAHSFSTQFNPYGVVYQDSLTIGVYLGIDTLYDGEYIYRCGSEISFQAPTSSGAVTTRLNTTNNQALTVDHSDGFWVNTRRAAADIELYLNYRSASDYDYDDTETDASTAVPNAYLYLLGQSTLYFSVNRISFFIVLKKGLTDDQVAILTIGTETLMSDIGASVL